MKSVRQRALLSPALAAILVISPRLAAAQALPAAQTGLAPHRTSAAQISSNPQAASRLDAHRPSRNYDSPVGDFEGQSDIGSAKLEGSALYDATAKQYTIKSAGYNTSYNREEFRFLWKKEIGRAHV